MCCEKCCVTKITVLKGLLFGNVAVWDVCCLGCLLCLGISDVCCVGRSTVLEGLVLLNVCYSAMFKGMLFWNVCYVGRSAVGRSAVL